MQHYCPGCNAQNRTVIYSTFRQQWQCTRCGSAVDIENKHMPIPTSKEIAVPEDWDRLARIVRADGETKTQAELVGGRQR